MNRITLLISPGVQCDFDQFAKKLCDMLNVQTYQKRFSENYVGGYYFVGIKDDLKFKICLSDEDDSNIWPFWVIVSKISEHVDLPLIIDAIAKSIIIQLGFRVARISNFGSTEEKRIYY